MPTPTRPTSASRCDGAPGDLVGHYPPRPGVERIELSGIRGGRVRNFTATLRPGEVVGVTGTIDSGILMTGQPANQMVEFPYVRMFNADNVGDLDLTPEAEKSGAWYGSTDYQDGFLELWGLNG